MSVFSKILFALTLLISAQSVGAKELTIYSVYNADQIGMIFAPFTQKTGIKVNIIGGSSDALYNQLLAEGDKTPADLYLDKDLVYLGRATRANLFQSFSSPVVEANVPKNLIEAQRNWTTLFYRARVIMYNTDKVGASELSTYQALGDKKWKGRLCLRTSSNSYNQALGAYLIAHYGPSKAKEIFKSWVANFAIEPMSGDRDVIRAIAEGTCDVGLANSYYLPPFIEADTNYPVRPFFPNQGTNDTHVNGVGIGIVKQSRNVKEATLLLEYLTSAAVQAPVADSFKQYPVNQEAPLNPILIEFGAFNADSTNIGIISNFTEMATELMKEAGYN